ncbi:MAG: ribonuclease D [Gomphosphaeria aponina SAG 52.96 = DSM 107014]|uniref:Ribonuclease D n=1 Tax=Gomphosphaeria aponina SAG 52.96 = DSM 107014 TaxID=1521640 RepID=A0A941GR30_9CHRO|nr:ribonuclease D [Gomphosphaeria aponina SAG 52.96 = DSM 107014]
MFYLNQPEPIQDLIDELAEVSPLWIDTEVADYNTKTPRLSLISILAYAQDLNGDRTCILDVLNQPKIVEYFINKIMVNPQIEKVFHNAAYDLRFLGKEKAKNITCTLKMAKSIPYYLLPIPNHTLKTLVEHFTPFLEVSKEEQTSDWGQRPLSQKQLAYAKLDPVYLCQIHQQLQPLFAKSTSDNFTDDLDYLEKRYREIEEEWKLLNSEMEAIQTKVKQLMEAKHIKETPIFKLSISERKTIKVDFYELAEKAKIKGLTLHFPVTLTQELQKKTELILRELNLQEDTRKVVRLISKNNG